MSKPTHSPTRLDSPVTYQITVWGQLDARWATWFEGMVIKIQRLDGGELITTLTGTVADQAALHGMLRAIYTLGLSLHSVNQLF